MSIAGAGYTLPANMIEERYNYVDIMSTRWVIVCVIFVSERE